MEWTKDKVVKKMEELRDKGFISASGLTTSLDFTINEGTVLYAVWSYIYGTSSTKTSTPASTNAFALSY